MDTVNDKQIEQAAPKPLRKPVALDRPSKGHPRRWVHATGSPESLHAMAVFYLKQYDYESAFKWDRKPEFTLAKVVCNLRNYYRQPKDATIKLVRAFFNSRSGFGWTADGIGLAWDLVAPFTPSLGLKDDTTVNRERAADLYDRVVDLILMLEPGGRVLASDLYEHFLALNPDINPVPTDTAFGIAVGEVTEKKSTPSKGKRYFSGFKIPKVDSLPAAA